MKLFFRSPIPDGSTLTVKVSTPDGTPGAFVASGDLVRHPGTKVAKWTDTQLRAGVSQALTPAGTYTGEIVISFAAQSTARLQMQVVKPDGSKFTYDEQVTQSSNVDTTDIILPVH
jgi:hypothetical protein